MQNNLPPHDCDNVMQKVHLALDGELTQVEMQRFLSELERCSHCLKNYNIETTFKDFLRKKISRHQIAEASRKSILEKISKIGIGIR